MTASRNKLINELRDAARQGADELVAELLSAGASPDAMSDYGYPVDVAVRAGHVATARSLLSAMRSPAAVRDLLADLTESDEQWAHASGEAAERFERLVTTVSDAVGVKRRRAFLHCSRRGSVDPAETRGILPFLTAANRMSRDPWGAHVCSVLLEVTADEVVEHYERGGADVRREARATDVELVSRGLAVVSFHGVRWTWIALVGTDRGSAQTLASSLAESFGTRALSVESFSVFAHEPDGMLTPHLAHELSTQDGPLVPHHFVERMRGRISLCLEGLAARHVESVSAVVLEPLDRPPLSAEDRALVERLVALCGVDDRSRGA